MKKIILLLFIVGSISANAQTSTTAVQTVDMHLINVIKIKFVNTGSNMGNTINLNLDNMSDLVSGVTSANQKLSVASTKPFNVNVKAASPTFNYSGSSQQNNVMNVDEVLQVRVNQNNTGGNIGSGYSAFNPITYNAQNIINGGNNGQDQQFRIRYKAVPGLGYAAGSYLASIIYCNAAVGV